MSEDLDPEHRDTELESLRKELRRYERRWRLFLRIRAGFGLLLLMSAIAGLALTLAFLGAGLGLLEHASLTRWTSGFDALLAVFMPGAFTWLCAKTGYAWWGKRHEGAPHDPEHGA